MITRLLYIFACTCLLLLMGCSGESNSDGVTIADRIEDAGAEAAAATISGAWADDQNPATPITTGLVDISDSMEISFAWDTENSFDITDIKFDGYPAVTLTGIAAGVADYNYVTDTMTIYASGTLDDTSNTMSFFMTIELTGIDLNTLSQAEMFDITNHGALTAVVEFEGGGFSHAYSLSAGATI